MGWVIGWVVSWEEKYGNRLGNRLGDWIQVCSELIYLGWVITGWVVSWEIGWEMVGDNVTIVISWVGEYVG